MDVSTYLLQERAVLAQEREKLVTSTPGKNTRYLEDLVSWLNHLLTTTVTRKGECKTRSSTLLISEHSTDTLGAN